jgi:transcription factor E
MLKDFLEEVMVIVAGKPAEPVADLLNSKKHVNEFNVAKKLDLTINQTRNILYKIADFGLVSSIRKKDKKKGWYTYFWKIEVLKTLEFLKAYVEKRMNQFENQITSRETKTFYVCERCNLEFNEENAMHQGFECPECGEVMTLKDNTKLIRELKRNHEKFSKKLEEINEEIDKENEKLEKEKEKERKKEEKEKEKKKAEKSAARKALNAKKKAEREASGKKTTKKKTAKKTTKKKTTKKTVKKTSKKKTTKKSTKKSKK